MTSSRRANAEPNDLEPAEMGQGEMILEERYNLSFESKQDLNEDKWKCLAGLVLALQKRNRNDFLTHLGLKWPENTPAIKND